MCFKYDYPRFDFAAYFYDYDIDMQTYITKNMALMNCILIEKFHSDFVEDINMIDPNFSFWKSGTTSFLEQILSWENSYNINSFVEEFLKRGAYPDIFISSYDTAHLSDNLGAHFSSFDKIILLSTYFGRRIYLDEKVAQAFINAGSCNKSLFLERFSESQPSKKIISWPQYQSKSNYKK